MCLVLCMKGSMSLLNMTLIYISCRVWDILTQSLTFLGFGNPFSSHSFKSYSHHDHWSYFESNTSKLWIHVIDMFKRIFVNKFKHLIPRFTFYAIILNHSHQIYRSFVSCWWCRKNYGPPSTDHFLSTPTHYPGKWSRKFLSVSWSLHASMASYWHSMIGSHHWPLNEWFCECLISNSMFTLMESVVAPWEPLPLLVVSLIPINSLHHSQVIRWFLPFLTSTHWFTWLDSYFGSIRTEMKSLGFI